MNNNGKLYPFNIEEAMNGAEVCTADGKFVRILCFDAKPEKLYPIVALVKENDGSDLVARYSKNGRYIFEYPSCYHLRIRKNSSYRPY